MKKLCALVVEDEPIAQEILADNLVDEGYEAICASNGEEAWRLIEAAPDRFDVILLDRMMPDMDGIEVLRRVKGHPVVAQTPVVMQTALTAASDIAAGLEAGAYYYLTKPFSAETLLAIVAAAIKDAQHRRDLENETRKTARSFSHLSRAEFRFRTPAEARDIAALVANMAPDPARVVLGLSELMLNAVEHGNLGITYDEKSALIQENRLMDEVEQRLERPEQRNRYAVLHCERTDGEVRFLVRDEGQGFNWQPYLEITPERAFDTHGRGIAMSRMISFDRLEYRGRGNEVLAIVSV